MNYRRLSVRERGDEYSFERPFRCFRQSICVSLPMFRFSRQIDRRWQSACLTSEFKKQYNKDTEKPCMVLFHHAEFMFHHEEFNWKLELNSKISSVEKKKKWNVKQIQMSPRPQWHSKLPVWKSKKLVAHQTFGCSRHIPVQSTPLNK